MIDRFEMARYYNQYVEALTVSRAASERLKRAREFPPASPDQIAELEAAYMEAQAKTDDLYCLYTTGMHKSELPTGPSPLDAMNKYSHWPEPGGALEAAQMKGKPSPVLPTLAGAGVERIRTAVSTSTIYENGGFVKCQ